jgi:hypothetical protein
MAHIDHLKRAILSYVGQHDLCTFSDLVAAIPGVEGEYVHELPLRNVMLWGDLSDEMVTALAQLFHDHRIFYVPTSVLAYLASGSVPNLPLAKSARQIDVGYAVPHWLPVLLTLHHPMPERAAADFAAWDAQRAAQRGAPKAH